MKTDCHFCPAKRNHPRCPECGSRMLHLTKRGVDTGRWTCTYCGFREFEAQASPTRFRPAIDPRGTAAVVSSLAPGPVPGIGDLARWEWLPGHGWTGYAEAMRVVRAHNRGRSRDPIAEDGSLDNATITG